MIALATSAADREYFTRKLAVVLHIRAEFASAWRASAEFAASQERLRRTEERLTVAVKRFDLNSKRASEERKGPRTQAWREAHADLAVADAYASGLDLTPFASMYRALVARVALSLNVEVRQTVVAGSGQGHAWQELREIEISKIVDGPTLTTALHELGHVAHQHEANHMEKMIPGDTPSRKRRICIDCELSAWEFAVDTIVESGLSWTRAMHADMKRGLTSYRKHGTPSQQARIDKLVSDHHRREIILDTIYHEQRKRGI
jgi:hypothetical protein